MLVLNIKKTIDEIIIASIPVLDPERNTAITITTKITLVKYFSILSAFASKNKPIGNPIAKTDAKPAGLSKLPVIVNFEWLDGSQPTN
jgi:hypothetical protein